MTCIDQRESLFDSALMQSFFHLRCDVDESAAGGEVKPEFFTKRFHARHCILKVGRVTRTGLEEKASFYLLVYMGYLLYISYSFFWFRFRSLLTDMPMK
jgi:hypothetical protein